MSTKRIHCGKRKEKKCLEAPETCLWNGEACVRIEQSAPPPSLAARIHCGKRKESTCKKAHPICSWDVKEEKCKRIIKSTGVRQPRCAGRKEPGCGKLPDMCEWTGEKCIKLQGPKKKQPKTKDDDDDVKIPKPPKKKQPKTKDDDEINVEPPKPPKKKKQVKVKDDDPETPKKVQEEPKPLPPKTPSPTKFVQAVRNLANRHCYYYTSRHHLKHTPIVNTQQSPKAPYDKLFMPLTNVHIGQRKLLLSEIQCLTRWQQEHSDLVDKGPIVLYVGAAPGTHLLLLSRMFPNAYFMLYDGAKFDRQLERYPQTFELNQTFVTTDLIKTLKKRRFTSPFTASRLVFISDIRLGAADAHSFESGVTRDMQMQEEWMEILRPSMSLLKFRMSYHLKHGEAISYTKGDILYGIWPKETSGETRLLVRQRDIGTKQTYDFKYYEQSMFFHNKYARPYCFTEAQHDKILKSFVFADKNNYCPCYDCMAELRTLQEYATTTNQDMNTIITMFASYMNRGRVPAFQRSCKGATCDPAPELQHVSFAKHYTRK